MTNKETIIYLFRKFPETKFSRAELMWKYLETYKGVKFGHITKQEFKDFFSGEFWGLERTAREMLKDPEFKLEPKIDQKRYQKEQEFLLDIIPKPEHTKTGIRHELDEKTGEIRKIQI